MKIEEKQSGKLERMKELIGILREAGRAYYQESREVMSNFEYDRLYDELLELERETGTVFGNSPTQNVGYEVVSSLPKERHESPMLSLNKTKSVEELKEWLGEQSGLLSWKMDGLTIVLTYEEGKLVKAVTRGNGEIGEVITNNAKTFVNVPMTIPYKGQLVLRGEAVIRYSDFLKINEEIEDVDARYKNPRNLCSGSVRQLNSEVTAQRKVRFFAFSLVSADGVDFKNSREEQFLWLKSQGFETVEYRLVTADTLEAAVASFSEAVEKNDVPSDGLVLLFDDIAYGQSLGRTAKFPRDSIAFKWADEIQETTLSYIEWSASRTGLINPVAVFEPVELEGTTVSRASVHNISIMEALELGEGDRITVYKANMIIPQIADNLTRSGVRDIPETCPVCGGKTEVRKVNDVKSLYCTNPDCQAKKIKSFTLFTSRDALNIGGLSEATLEKLIGRGWIHSYMDIYSLDQHKDDLIRMEGFGEKSWQRLWAAIQASRNTTFERYVIAMDIPMIGNTASGVLCREFHGSLEEFRDAVYAGYDFRQLPDFGDTLHNNIHEWFCDEDNFCVWEELQMMMNIQKTAAAENQATDQSNPFAGKTIVVTGKVEPYTRDEMNSLIASLGAVAGSSVTRKTNYLVCGEKAGSKLSKARELGIPVLMPEEFFRMAGVA